MAYNEEQIETIFNTICERIEEGESLRAVLRDKDMPSSRTFFKWIDGNEDKVKQYARAIGQRADYIFDQMFDIADDGTNDFTNKDIGDGVNVQVLNSEHIQRSRLRIDTRKWALSKMNPKKYGDKLGLEHSGEIKTKDLSEYSTEELLQRADAIRKADNE
jgi:autonomous glycyl radical cofactor GrcA